jgi:hypothetical protein
MMLLILGGFLSGFFVGVFVRVALDRLRETRTQPTRLDQLRAILERDRASF